MGGWSGLDRSPENVGEVGVMVSKSAASCTPQRHKMSLGLTTVPVRTDRAPSRLPSRRPDGHRPTTPSRRSCKVDNKAGISFQHRTNPDTRLKGTFDLRDKWVSELQNEGKICAVKVDTKLNCADLFTKAFVSKEFQRLVQLIQMHK